MSEIKFVRLYPIANTSVGAPFTTIGGKAVSEAWRELAEEQEERYKGNTNGSGGSELLPLETKGVKASTTSGAVAAFRATPLKVEGGQFSLSANEKLLSAKVVGRFKQVTTKSLEISAGGGGLGEFVVFEKEAFVEGTTPAFWASISWSAEDVNKMNASEKTLHEVLEDGSMDIRLVKAKEALCFTLYIELEIEVKSIGWLSCPGKTSMSGSLTAVGVGATSPRGSMSVGGSLGITSVSLFQPRGVVSLVGAASLAPVALMRPSGSTRVPGSLRLTPVAYLHPVGNLHVTGSLSPHTAVFFAPSGSVRVSGGLHILTSAGGKRLVAYVTISKPVPLPITVQYPCPLNLSTEVVFP